MDGQSTREQAVRLKEKTELLFFWLFSLVLALSCVMLFFLAFARRAVFSAVDPSSLVVPFLGYTLAIPCAFLALTLSALYFQAHSSYLLNNPAEAVESKRPRILLYPAAAFGTLAAILFLAGCFGVVYLVIL